MKTKNHSNWIWGLVATLVLLSGQITAANNSERGADNLKEKVRHELAMLPYYGVFDNLAFRVEGDTVVLLGQVTRPTLSSDAERIVAKLEGVAAVKNEIEVLPLSAMDDRSRLRLLRAIYGGSVLGRYAIQPRSPIRILVNRGDVTLAGTVDRTMDSTLAYMAAMQTPGVFSVTNKLVVMQVENKVH